MKRVEKEKIINFFALNIKPSERIGEKFEHYFGFSYDQASDLSYFLKDWEEVKVSDDTLVGLINDKDEKGQVIELLNWFQKGKYRSDNSTKIQKVMLSLIQKKLFTQWSVYITNHFNSVMQMLHPLQWRDYFCSYSRCNRREVFAGPSAINNRYKKIIKRHLSRSITKSNDAWEEENLLARTICHIIRKDNLTHFFDSDDINYGDNLDDEIFAATKSTFCFLQIVQKDIFSMSIDSDDNYCFKEYTSFYHKSKELYNAPSLDNEVLKKRYFYVALLESDGNFIPQDGYHEVYSEWINSIKPVFRIDIPIDIKPKKFEAKIVNLAKSIRIARKNLIENVTFHTF